MRNRKIFGLIAIAFFLGLVCYNILDTQRVRKEVNQIQEQLEKLDLTLKQLETVFFEKQQNFAVWKTIELGTHENTDAIRKALRSNGFTIEYWANDILNKIPFGQKRAKLNLVLVSTGQLGFKDVATYQEIYKRAQELGFKPVPAEVAPQLRLQYPNQPENEWLHIGMEPIIASDGDPTVFDIMNDDHHGIILCSSSVRSDILWSPSSRWVFATN